MVPEHKSAAKKKGNGNGGLCRTRRGKLRDIVARKEEEEQAKMVQEAIGTLTEVISHYVNHSVDLVEDCQRTLQKSIKSLSLLQKLYVVAHFTCPGQRTHERLMGISTKLLECTTAIPKPELDAVSNRILMEEALCSALILDQGFMFPFYSGVDQPS